MSLVVKILSRDFRRDFGWGASNKCEVVVGVGSNRTMPTRGYSGAGSGLECRRPEDDFPPHADACSSVESFVWQRSESAENFQSFVEVVVVVVVVVVRWR